jgi:predicted secreted protein
MASVAGYKKSIYITATTASTAWIEIPATSGDLQMSANMLDDTNFTSTGWTSRVAGLKTFSISGNAVYDTSNTAITALSARFLDGAKMKFRYDPAGTSHGFSGTVIVENFSLSGGVNDLSQISFSLQSASQAFSTY